MPVMNAFRFATAPYRTGPDVYAGDMRVLVTGGGGFLGSHLVERLRGEGFDPFVARRADYDLTLAANAAELFDDAQPELVLHLAAEVGGIGANRANPGRYWYANSMMGLNVLEAARVHGTRKVVVLGTICEYPKHTPVPFREDDLWQGYPGEIAWDTSKPNGQPRRKLDTSRAKELFGFEARTPLRKGLERTIAWYRAHLPARASAR